MPLENKMESKLFGIDFSEHLRNQRMAGANADFSLTPAAGTRRKETDQ